MFFAESAISFSLVSGLVSVSRSGLVCKLLIPKTVQHLVLEARQSTQLEAEPENRVGFGRTCSLWVAFGRKDKEQAESSTSTKLEAHN